MPPFLFGSTAPPGTVVCAIQLQESARAPICFAEFRFFLNFFAAGTSTLDPVLPSAPVGRLDRTGALVALLISVTLFGCGGGKHASGSSARTPPSTTHT